jgi:hypothetical protein
MLEPITMPPRPTPILLAVVQALAALRRRAVLGLGVGLTAGGLAGCSKAPDPAAVSAPPKAVSGASASDSGVAAAAGTAASALIAATLTPAVTAAVAAGPTQPAIAWRKPHSEAEIEAAFAEARSRGEPVFLYWGAVWCPPCNQVKATVFNRPDFIEKSRRFVPVYLDGDLPAAQKLGARFRVGGYPTMVLLRPDGSELTRLPGGVDAKKYLDLLDLGLGAARPARTLLAQALSAPGDLSGPEWRLLAYYAWEVDEQQLLPKAQQADALERLAAVCPPAQADAATRLMLRALIAGAGSAAAPSPAGRTAARSPAGRTAAPSPASAAAEALRRERLNRVLALLADDTLARENLDIVGAYASELTAALTTAGTPEREQLQGLWAAALDRLTADTRLSQGDRMEALNARIKLALMEAPKGAKTAAAPASPKAPKVADAPNPPQAAGRDSKPNGTQASAGLSEVLKEHVRAQVARADREVASPVERQSVISSAADALTQSGQLAESDALLSAELQRSPAPYYFMLHLASNARERGDPAAALQWGERAWRESQGPATRLQWGVSYLGLLLDLAPQDAPRIEAATLAVLGELEGQTDAFYDRTQRRLETLSRKLLAWHQARAQPAVLQRLRDQRDRLCRALPPADPQRATCEAFLNPVPTRPAAGVKT